MEARGSDCSSVEYSTELLLEASTGGIRGSFHSHQTCRGTFRGRFNWKRSCTSAEVASMEMSMNTVDVVGAPRHSLKGVEVNYNQWKFTEVRGSTHRSAEASMKSSISHFHGSFHW